MTLTELQKALRAVEPAAVLVPPRVLENIVWQTWNLSGFFWTVPHRRSFIIDRQTLFRHVDQEELVLGPDELLPATVILLAWPIGDTVQAESKESLLLKYWQRLFHASIHLVLENLWTESKLTLPELRSRIAEIGATQFEEIRNILIQDSYLAAAADDRTVYMEFAAVFLEEYYFCPGLLESTFPGLGDREAVRKLLERDVDAEGLFRRLRLAGAADPVLQTATVSQEPHEFYYKLIGSSERAQATGNVVLAAIQKRRAARVAPPALAFDTMQAAHADLQGLMNRLQKALDLNDAAAAEWQSDLFTLLDKADQGTRPPEAALLYDLQKVCLDHEQDIYALDLVEWILSMGRRPIKRPLPSQRLVRLTRHLRSATQRLTMARLSDTDRKHLAGLLQNSLLHAETMLRERFRPVFISALEDVGLKPRNPPERTAFAKMIEELLDRILAYGFLTFSDLRDTVSRNSLKLPDLNDPHDFIRGDPLLRLDRRLATLLDGVYRRGEFYLRWLERFTALNFGTKLGRQLTRFVTMPFGGAFLLIEAVQRFILHPLHIPTLDPFAHPYAYLPLLLTVGFFLLGLIHSPRVREKTRDVGLAIWRPMRAVLIKGPLWLIRNPALDEITKTWTFQLFYWYLLKPLLGCIVWFWIEHLIPVALSTDPWWLKWLIVFLAVNFLLNIKPVQDAGKALSHALVNFVEMLRGGLLPSLVSWIGRVFKRVVHLVEAMLFYVDEWLRFRQGDSQLAMAVRAVLTVLWFPISYLARFNMVVLIEPALNPLKLPVCSIATKFWIPVATSILASLESYDLVTRAIGIWLVFWFPDVFGFFFWEIKENWSLYRANRSRTLQPAVVGTHGETLPRLLQPGFHGGTVPKLFARLRQAERVAYRTGNWSAVRSYRASLEHIEEAIQLFVIRDFVALLQQDPHWHDQGLKVGKVHLATNRISIEFLHPQHPEAPVLVEFENRSGWLLAGLGAAGWLEHLTPEQMRPLHNSLITLYKLAGVDLVREQLQTLIPAQASGTDLTPQGLAIRLDGRPTPAVYYNLRTAAENIPPRLAEGIADDGWPIFQDRQVLFREVPVTWEECVRSWLPDPTRNGLQLLAHDVEVMPTVKANGTLAEPPKEATTL